MTLKLLVKGWTAIPHSYAIVNCFQLVHLVKKYKDDIKIYVDEMPYYRKEWETKKKLVYGSEYNAIINSFQKWSGQEVDLVYSITYPYDITYPYRGGHPPKVVFYTSEFAWLDNTFFIMDGVVPATVDDVKQHIETHKGSLFFTAPSIWSANGLKEWGVNDNRNKVITHGVDPTIFKQLDEESRGRVRGFYRVKDDDILLINIGAMTGNKGVVSMFAALYELVKEHKNVKLLLKGTGDLYSSKEFVEMYMSSLKKEGVLGDDDVDNLLENHVIFTDKTMSYSTINELFNAADMYVSPYLAEGFNLTVLESLAAGLPVLVPTTGSTREFMQDLYEHGGKLFIHYLDSQVGRFTNGMMQNTYKIESLVEVLRAFVKGYKYTDRRDNYGELRSWIVENYSWGRVAEYLWDYFRTILKGVDA